MRIYEITDRELYFLQNRNSIKPPMGFNPNPNKKYDPIKDPIRTFNEILDIFNLSHQRMRALMGHYPGFPEPLTHIGNGKKSYYKVNAVKRWIRDNNIKL